MSGADTQWMKALGFVVSLDFAAVTWISLALPLLSCIVHKDNVNVVTLQVRYFLAHFQSGKGGGVSDQQGKTIKLATLMTLSSEMT